MPYTKNFLDLKQSIKENYLGRPVPKRFQKIYGKKYNKKDILPLTYAIAKSRGIKIDWGESKKLKGGMK